MKKEFICPKGKSILIFGGHEDWIKGMKKQISGITIVKEDCHYGTIKLKNADEIWIQHNAISHSLYRKVLAESREKNIPLHYFYYSSHKKCVEQLVKEYGISC